MQTIPEKYALPCSHPGNITKLSYGDKFFLLYTPVKPAEHILYLIHGGGGDQYSFFRIPSARFRSLSPWVPNVCSCKHGSRPAPYPRKN